MPSLTEPVMDIAGLLQPETKSKLNSSLHLIWEKGGPQIAIFIIPKLDELTLEEASFKVVDKWKLGKAKEDNGVLLLVASQDRKLRIEVGQGLEGNLTDLDSKRIIDNLIVPQFKNSNYDAGIVTGVYEIVKKTSPELSGYLTSQFGKQNIKKYSRKNMGIDNFAYLILFIIIGIIRLIFFRRRGLFGMGSSGLGGYGGSGGFSGGGFGGFSGGGGGFSGGGGSGSW